MSWEDDKLNRKQEANYLVKYICHKYEANQETSLSINLNASWGDGKSYFLRNLKKDLAASGHPVVYYDAWENDYSKEALVSFIAEISDMLLKEIGVNTRLKNKVEKFKSYGIKVIKNSIPTISEAVVKHVLRTDFDTLSEKFKDSGDDSLVHELEGTLAKLSSVTASTLLAEHNETKNSISDFKKALKDIVSSISGVNSEIKQKELPIFILVDELDRCRPSFAIELLESIKHLFGIQGIVFISATNTKELQASVKAIYGDEFSADKYLKRFFDIEYRFNSPKLNDLALYILDDISIPKDIHFYVEADSELEKLSFLFSSFSRYFKMNPRDMKQAKLLLEACFYTEKETFELPLLLIIIMAWQKQDEVLLSLLNRGDVGNQLRSHLASEIYDSKIKIPSKKKVQNYRYVDDAVSVYQTLSAYIINDNKTSDQITYLDNEYSLISSIAESIQQNLMKDEKAGIIRTPIIKRYIEMVKQAGRFSEDG